jgi:hypothetical protein
VFVACLYILIICGTLLGLRGSTSQGLQEHLLIAKRNLLFPIVLFSVGVGFLSVAGFRRTRKFGIIAIILLVSVDGIRFGQKFTPFTDSMYFFPETKIISYLKGQPKPFRVLAADDRILPPNSAAYYGIEMVSGYDPLYSKYFESFVAAHNRNKADLTKPYGFNRIILPSLAYTSVFPLFNTKYVVTYGPTVDPNLSLIMNEGQSYLYEVTSFLPRAFLVSHVIPSASFEESIAKLYEKDFSIKQEAVVVSSLDIQSRPLTAFDSVKFVSYQESTIELQVATSEQRLLVITNNYFPGWHATIDGELRLTFFPAVI